MLYTSPIPLMRGPLHSDLELQFIWDYLKAKGYTRRDLLDLPENKAHRILGEARRYAVIRLSKTEPHTKTKTEVPLEK